MSMHATRSLAFRLSAVSGLAAFVLVSLGPSILFSADDDSAATTRQAVSADALKDLAARLKKATGAQWYPYTMPAGTVPRKLLWTNLTKLNGMAAHYEILAASPADQVGKRPADDRYSAIELKVIATNDRYTVAAPSDFEPKIAAKIVAALDMKLPKDLPKKDR